MGERIIGEVFEREHSSSSAENAHQPGPQLPPETTANRHQRRQGNLKLVLIGLVVTWTAVGYR